MLYPEDLQKVVEIYKKMPGVGDKTAERMALSIIDISKEEVVNLSTSLLNCKKKLKECEICGHLTDTNKCSICLDNTRDDNLICVLEDFKSVYAFEKAGNFKGKYHVLNKLISPLDNIGPDDINFNSLKKRLNQNEKYEIIIALKSTIEGETTTLYIQKMLQSDLIKVSRLSYGIPIGAEIDYIDALTLDKALEDRKEMV